MKSSRLVTTFVVLACVVGSIAGSSSLLTSSVTAQTILPAYPSSSPGAGGSRCSMLSPTCVVCPGDTQGYGCDSGIPAGWFSGSCFTPSGPPPAATTCNQASFRGGGDQIDCIFGYYTGKACFYNVICQDK